MFELDTARRGILLSAYGKTLTIGVNNNDEYLGHVRVYGFGMVG